MIRKDEQIAATTVDLTGMTKKLQRKTYSQRPAGPRGPEEASSGSL